MMTVFSNAIASIRAWFKNFRVQNALTVAVIGVLLVVSNADLPKKNDALGKAIREDHYITDQSDRPKTTREWNQEAREVEGKPVERIKRIAKESGDAFKEFGAGYVEGAKETADDVREGASRLTK